MLTKIEQEELSLNEWRDVIHDSSRKAGWWNSGMRLEEMGRPNKVLDPGVELLATKIALIHSEVSEMLEGLRKGLADEHLSHRTMEEVEAADIFIRLADYCGARGLDLMGAVRQKLEYNQHRADHKKEARDAEGGKKF